jgi:hypothetical protein
VLAWYFSVLPQIIATVKDRPLKARTSMPLSGHLPVIDAWKMIIDVARQQRQGEVIPRRILSEGAPAWPGFAIGSTLRLKILRLWLDSTIELIDTKLLISPTPFREE